MPESSQQSGSGDWGAAGLLNDTSRGSDPAASPTAGAFYNDGAEGDIRGRSENSFPGQEVSLLQERMLVYQGGVTVEVARVEDATARLLAKTAEWGGYLASQNGARLTVRVPAARFDEAFAWLRAQGRVLDEQRQANDVTEEFTDLGIRIDNARRARERLLALLEKAQKVEDMLKIEEQVRRLTEEIERLEGRKKLLADQVAMATLRAQFVAPTAVDRPVAEPSRFDWIRRVGAEALLGRW